jgi:hypothetical protein
MGDLTWFGKVVEVLGPVATVLFVLLVLGLYMYRRDFLLKTLLSQEERDRMAAIVERNANTSEKLAEAVTRLSDSTRESSDRYTRQIEQMIQLTEGHRGRRRAR